MSVKLIQETNEWVSNLYRTWMNECQTYTGLKWMSVKLIQETNEWDKLVQDMNEWVSNLYRTWMNECPIHSCHTYFLSPPSCFISSCRNSWISRLSAESSRSSDAARVRDPCSCATGDLGFLVGNCACVLLPTDIRVVNGRGVERDRWTAERDCVICESAALWCVWREAFICVTWCIFMCDV